MIDPAEHERLKEELAAKDKVIERLEAKVAELEKLVESLSRAGKRQAAPFSRGRKSSSPKKSGRKKGHAGSKREIPERADRVVRGEALSCSPDCGGGVSGEWLENWEIDLPVIEPVVTRFLFQKAKCRACRKTFVTPAEGQTSTATGAAGVHLGSRVRGFAAEMKHGLGVPYRKTARILDSVFNFKDCHGALVRSDARLAKDAAPTIEAMTKELRSSDLAHADETGWRVEAESAWLWVCCTTAVTVYRIVDHCTATVIADILGPDFEGRLMRDSWKSYDTRLTCQMLRCLLHLQRNAQDLEKRQSVGAVRSPRYFLRWMERLFKLRNGAAQMTDEAYQEAAKELVEWFDWFTTDRNYSNPANAAFAASLKAARDQILPIVQDHTLPAHNYTAEQQIRPAVIARKIAAGNKTWPGAAVAQTLMSIAATARQATTSLTTVFADVIRQQRPIVFWQTAEG